MKKAVQSILAAAAALFMALGALSPLSAIKAEASALDITVPEGYNAHDYTAIAAFFELADENGIKNGEKLNSNYDANDPATWISIDEFNNVFEHVRWTEQNGEKLLWFFDIAHVSAIGALDLSHCPYLEYVEATNNRLDSIDTRGCPALSELYCDNNGLGAIDVSDNPLLSKLWCDANALTELNVSNNPALYDLSCNSNRLTSLDLGSNHALIELYCEGNLLTELELSANTELSWLWCPNNRLERLDLSSNTQLVKLFASGNLLSEIVLGKNTKIKLIDCMNNRISSLDVSENTALSELAGAGNAFNYLKLNSLLGPNTVRTDGDGSFGYHYSIPYGEGFLSARANEGSVFAGWYDQSGEFVTASPYIEIYGSEYTELIARFTPDQPFVPGDADGNGSVNTADAIFTLRYAMGLIGPGTLNLINSDVTNDGTVSIADAVMILRIAMGLN